MYELPARFINWSVIDGRKVPVSPSGVPIDPHQPNAWLTEDAARATGLPVGFVLNGDGIGFLDLDKCYDGTAWHPHAVALFGMFPMSMAEVSSSGTGLHRLIRVRPEAFAGKRRKFRYGDVACEFYVDKRFVAFGPGGWQGDVTCDYTDVLLSVIPDGEDAEPIAPGRDPEWAGPEDDDELLRRMLQSRPGLGAAFGNGATVQDLWEARADVLSRIFPSPSGQSYDASSADMALMIHLAFWTGRDGPRMDRLFRRSGLMREKYERREDYRNETVNRARGRASGVYKDPRGVSAAPVQAVASESVTSVTSATTITRPNTTFLTVTEMQEYFRGCVYVRSLHRVMIPGGDLLKPEQFKSFMGGYEFTMSHAGGPKAATTNAFEAFTECKLYDFPKARGICFRPHEEPGVITADELVNTYFPASVTVSQGDVSRWLRHVSLMLPNERDQQVLHNYLAVLAQYRGTKMRWAPVIQGVEGNGKGLTVEIARYIVGKEFTYTPRSSDIPKQFNSWVRNRLLIGVNEVHMEGRRDFLDAIKPLITDEEMPTEPKGTDQFLIENFCNWIMTTNYRDAVIKSRNDRRFAMFFTAQQSVDDLARDGMTGDYFPSLWTWLRGEGFAAIAGYYERMALTVDLETFIQRAPDTSSTAEAVTASMGRIEQEIAEAVEAGDAGFRNGWVSSYAVTRVLERVRINVSPRRMQGILEDMGYRQVCRSSRCLMNEDGRRPVVYVLAAQWREGLTVDDYCTAQNYGADVVVSAPQGGQVVPFRLPGS